MLIGFVPLRRHGEPPVSCYMPNSTRPISEHTTAAQLPSRSLAVSPGVILLHLPHPGQFIHSLLLRIRASLYSTASISNCCLYSHSLLRPLLLRGRTHYASTFLCPPSLLSHLALAGCFTHPSLRLQNTPILKLCRTVFEKISDLTYTALRLYALIVIHYRRKQLSWSLVASTSRLSR